MNDTTTKEGMHKRLMEFVASYTETRNWKALTRLIGGVPREDLQDYIPGYDDGEPQRGY